MTYIQLIAVDSGVQCCLHSIDSILHDPGDACSVTCTQSRAVFNIPANR